MGKRQTRIFTDKIAEKAGFITGREANITLYNGTTLHGVILAVAGQKLQFRDMRLKNHALLLEDISEVIVDQVTEW